MDSRALLVERGAMTAFDSFDLKCVSYDDCTDFVTEMILHRLVSILLLAYPSDMMFFQKLKLSLYYHHILVISCISFHFFLIFL